MPNKALVLGASGFLGSHVAKELVKQGRDVRILVRETSDTRATDHLDVERCYGDVMDRDSLDKAMAGCDSIFYCVVDTRAWLRDPAPLYRVNVDGLTNAMDAATDDQHFTVFTRHGHFLLVESQTGLHSTDLVCFNQPNAALRVCLGLVGIVDRINHPLPGAGP